MNPDSWIYDYYFTEPDAVYAKSKAVLAEQIPRD